MHRSAEDRIKARRAEQQRIKTEARRLFANAVRNGKIKRPDTCELCHLKGASTLHGHHWDYRRPLKVMWLCSACHKRIHWENDGTSWGLAGVRA